MLPSDDSKQSSISSPQPSAITRASRRRVHLSSTTRSRGRWDSARDEAVGKTRGRARNLDSRGAGGFHRAHARRRRSEAPRRRFALRDGRELRTVLAIAPVEFGGETMLRVRRDRRDGSSATCEDALRSSEAQARARADDLAALMDAVPAAVWISHDRECREIRGNRAGYEVLRMPMGSNLSKTASDPVADATLLGVHRMAELRADQLPLQRAARGEEFRNYEEELRFDDGKVTHLFGNVVPLRDPDGTPRGRDRCFARRDSLEGSRGRVASRRSPQGRVPRAVVARAAQSADADSHRGAAARAVARTRNAVRSIEVITRQVKHLVRLVDDLLDMSRVSRGAVTLTKAPVGARDVVARAVAATAPLFEEHRPPAADFRCGGARDRG